MLPQKRPFEEEVVDDDLDEVLSQSEDKYERHVCDLGDGLDEIFSQAVDMIEEAIRMVDIIEIGGSSMTCARVAQKSKGNVMQVIY